MKIQPTHHRIALLTVLITCAAFSPQTNAATTLSSGHADVFEVEYEQVQPWLLLEVKRDRERIPRSGAAPHQAAKTELMPMVRFIHRRWFLELGARGGGGHLSFMWVP